MSEERLKPAMEDLVEPFLTEKTRRAVAIACGCPSPRVRKMRTRFFRELTVGEMLTHIPTYEMFCECTRGVGQLGPDALEKARSIYE